MPGLFIDVKVSDKAAKDAAVVAKLEEVCPVDIFVQEESGALRIVEENLDECVLCDLCMSAAPSNSVEIVKLYE
ncbi:MAG: ferredoxin family protein [Deltaproteobacteria bacterium]|jgi:NAD-dependent dihydropyrimidine dehydrogenase PreA subunit|nr:ferredoxin family protein [Deltaproteobacteria bacterium]MBW2542180.1 ferredoxin family protein [Deltaproteobacteria bacterium]